MITPLSSRERFAKVAELMDSAEEDVLPFAADVL